MDRPRLRRALALGAGGGSCLAFASPPGVVPGAELLVVPGIALFIEVSLLARHRKVALFVFGFVLIAWVGWSLRYVSFAGYALMPVLAGLWMLGLGQAVRASAGLGNAVVPWAAALVWASWEFLRAEFPTIPYPHGQIAHALYAWPSLLGPVRLGGEPAMNLLVAGLGAAAWGMVRGRGAGRIVPLVALAAAWTLASIPPAPLAIDGAPLRVACIQHGVQPFPDQPGHALGLPEAVLPHYRSLVAKVRDSDLICWPESSLSGVEEGKEAATMVALAPWLARPGATVALGCSRRLKDGRRANTAILARDGRVLGMRDKRILVPVGETLPFWLDWLRWLLPGLPDLAVGAPQPVPRLADGGAIGLPICFENAFPGPFAALARGGAGAFVVLSFEGWYRLGSELDQMLAMTVFRALETGRDVVRATSDGFTCHVDGAGRVVASLALGRPGVLETRVQRRHGSRPAMRWGPRVAWLSVLASVVLAVAGAITGRAARLGDPG